MEIRRISLLTLITLFIAANASFAQLSAPDVVSAKMYVSPAKVIPGKTFDVIIKATVKDGYHIASADKDATYPAKLTINAPKGITFDKPVYPNSVRKAFPISPGQKIPVYEGTITIKVKGHTARNFKPGQTTITASFVTQACKGDQCFPPETTKISTTLNIVKSASNKAAAINTDPSAGLPAGDRTAAMLAGAGPVKRFGLLYGLGLLLAFTPCVYPMIPVTVGYFSSQGRQNKRRVASLAAAYVLGLALTYSTLGVIAASTGSALGAAMQFPAVIIVIAAILVLLALSMFGLFELQAPAFIQSRASGRSGILGALFMGLIFGVVAAPCVGPAVIGTALYVAELGNAVAGFTMFFALAIGLGTPLFLLATFSAKMPVPGMWMVTVKKIAGFLLLGAAAYFLKPILSETINNLLLPAVILAGGIYLGCFDKTLKSSRLAQSFGRGFCITGMVTATVMAWPSAKQPSADFIAYKPAILAEAVKSGQPVIVDFSAKWCMACKELDEKTFSNPDFIKAAERFVKLRVDGTTRTQAVEAAEAKLIGSSGRGYPVVIFIDSSGKEVKSARINGFVNAKEMLQKMKQVK